MIWAFGQELPIWLCLIFDLIVGAIASVLYDLIYRPHQGIIHITEGHEGKPDRYLFEFNIEPEIIRSRRYVAFKIVKERESQKIQEL